MVRARPSTNRTCGRRRLGRCRSSLRRSGSRRPRSEKGGRPTGDSDDGSSRRSYAPRAGFQARFRVRSGDCRVAGGYGVYGVSLLGIGSGVERSPHRRPWAERTTAPPGDPSPAARGGGHRARRRVREPPSPPAGVTASRPSNGVAAFFPCSSTARMGALRDKSMRVRSVSAPGAMWPLSGHRPKARAGASDVAWTKRLGPLKPLVEGPFAPHACHRGGRGAPATRVATRPVGVPTS